MAARYWNQEPYNIFSSIPYNKVCVNKPLGKCIFRYKLLNKVIK